MKKLLALVLALVMVMGLATVSTNAAYSDNDKINHGPAVEVLSAVGIINGRTDGSFDPEGSVTRAEMAKMITILKLGDVDVSAFKGTTTDLTDIDGHWAEAYIKYCYSQGVISGRGNGIFDPNANVTTAEAAKMLLVILGYNADVQGYTGGKWAINVTRDAQLKKFFNELSNLTSDKKLNRDEAAQLIYNCATASRVIESKEIDTNGVISTRYTDADQIQTIQGSKDEKLLGKTFDAYEKETYLAAVSYDRDKKEYDYTFETDGETNGNIYLGEDITGSNALDTSGNADGKLANVKSTADFSDLFAQKIKVVFKYDEKKGENTLLGMYGQGKILATTTMGEITNSDDKTKATTAQAIANGDEKVCLDGKTYKLDTRAANTYFVGVDTKAMNDFFGADAVVINNNAAKVAMDNAQSNYTFAVAAIDNDNDGKVDVFSVTPVDYFKVTYAGGSTIVAERILANGTGNETGKSFSKDSDSGLWDCKIDGNNKVHMELPSLAKDDFFKVTYGVESINVTAEKLNTVEGKVTGEKKYNQATNANVHSIQVDGNWYDDLQYSNKATFDDEFLDNTYTFVFDNGYFFYADEITSGSKDILLATSDGVGDVKSVRASVMFTDGTEETITVKKVDGVDAVVGDVDEGTLYTYTKKSSGYELKVVGHLDNGKEVLAGNDKFVQNGTFTKKTDNKAANIDNYTIDDKAVVFLNDSDASSNGGYSVITGERLKTLKIDPNNNGGSVNYLIKGSTVKVAYIHTGTDRVKAGSIYAFATANSYATKYKDEDAFFTTVWTEDGAKDIYTVKDGGAGSMAKGSVYEIKELSDGSYEVVDGGAKGTIVAISKYTASDKSLTAVAFDGTDTYLVADNYKITNDTVILNVNKDDNKGVEGTAINEATRDENENLYSNATILMDTGSKDDEILLIVYDVRNDWSGNLNDDSANNTLGDITGTNLGVKGTAVTPDGGKTNAFTVASKEDSNTHVVADDTFSVTFKSANTGTITIDKDDAYVTLVGAALNGNNYEIAYNTANAEVVLTFKAVGKTAANIATLLSGLDLQ